MRAWDYVIPHRLAINKVLHNVSDDLRERVDAYRIEFERQEEKCQSEIEEAEVEKNEKFNSFREVLSQELQNEYVDLEEAYQDLVQYVDSCLRRRSLTHLRKTNKHQADLFRDADNFLSSQMKYIGDEIDILRDRRDELSAFVSVEDIIQLSDLSGCDINFTDKDNAETLLEKVKSVLDKYSNECDTEKIALMRLRTIIQERADYLPAIRYIDWAINQKKQYSNKLSLERSRLRKQREIIKLEGVNIKKEIENTDRQIIDLAKLVRYYWMKPITYINAEITYEYSIINKNSEKLKEVGDELHQLASWHSNDQKKWNRLDDERKGLLEKIESSASKIDRKKEDKKEWNRKREFVKGVCKKIGIRSVNGNNIIDEEDIIKTRLQELKEIRLKGEEEARRICAQERIRIQEKHSIEMSLLNKKRIENLKKINDLELQREEIDDQISHLQSDFTRNSNKIKRIENQRNKRCISAYDEYLRCKNNDHRFFLLKVLINTLDEDIALMNISEAEKFTSEEIRNKLALESALRKIKIKISEKENLLLMIGEKQDHEEAEKKKIEEEISSSDIQFEKEIEECHPRIIRPTAEERHEEKILKFKEAEIEKRKKQKAGKAL